MEEQAVKCRICGKSYNIKGDCTTDQSICPSCRWKEKNPKGEGEPLDFSGLKRKFKIGGRNGK